MERKESLFSTVLQSSQPHLLSLRRAALGTEWGQGWGSLMQRLCQEKAELWSLMRFQGQPGRVARVPVPAKSEEQQWTQSS